MTINYDEKGKIFTDIVPKEPVKARIQTISHLIEGEIYIRPEYRLKDELDIDEPFLAVTNAIIYSAEGTPLFQTKFIAIRRDQVIWVSTAEDLGGEEPT